MAEEDDEMVTITAFPSERTAREKAKELVEHGVGAIIARGLPEEHNDPEPYEDPVAHRNTDEYVASFELRVMRHQVTTACEVLDLEVPVETQAELVEERKESAPWKRILLIWAVAMVVIPVAAGLLSYYILSR